jgi:hypothetical protein
MKTVIYVDNDGNLQGLADDIIDKLAIGKKQIKRVSDIEWSHTENLWVAYDSQAGQVIAKAAIRSDVINAEREFLNKRIEQKFACSK